MVTHTHTHRGDVIGLIQTDAVVNTITLIKLAAELTTPVEQEVSRAYPAGLTGTQYQQVLELYNQV